MQRRILATLVAVLLLVLGLGLVQPSDAAGPPNTAPKGLHRCATSGAVTRSCLKHAVKDYDRARRREGVGPVTLPSNFITLTAPAQLMVLADLDRVDRGLAPVAGLASTLQPYAQRGAQQSRDPSFPAWTMQGGGNWASTASPVWAEFLWMYDDGPGSGNLDCTTATDAGCYGHRNNILGHYRAPTLMGAGSDARGGATQLFLGGDTHDRADVLTWHAERRLIPVGVSKRRLKHAGDLDVWASGRAMKVRVRVSHGWHANHRRCTLRAGQACTLHVSGKGHGTLRLRGPNGTVTVALGRG
ncbi:hypothetical protein P5P86_07390 [Nocardioides sp. BP30]|uniref:hypothetical protein n=1 Tax=Nocardioides sp. BP30 TaxID=3036374 RepID=UPI0024694F3D|nr:hypothetical protein [Nocardioides sp. BP30]WGL53648.1 hypothetical protein P5P86_07390 [Nocardioides sp. BP30]